MKGRRSLQVGEERVDPFFLFRKGSIRVESFVFFSSSLRPAVMGSQLSYPRSGRGTRLAATESWRALHTIDETEI
jgi:hypothetical protein